MAHEEVYLDLGRSGCMVAHTPARPITFGERFKRVINSVLGIFGIEVIMKIKSVEFVENTTNGVGNKVARVTLEDGTVVDAFAFYSDEIGFSATELVGLTVEQAKELKHSKDREYLQS